MAFPQDPGYLAWRQQNAERAQLENQAAKAQRPQPERLIMQRFTGGRQTAILVTGPDDPINREFARLTGAA